MSGNTLSDKTLVGVGHIFIYAIPDSDFIKNCRLRLTPNPASTATLQHRW